MSVVNGQPVDAATVNAAFVSRTEDTSTVGKLALQNSAPESGAFVANPQQAINETFDTVGIAGLADPNAKNYASTNVVANGMNRKEAIEALDGEFGSISGVITGFPTHDHDGINSQQISAANLLDINQLQAAWQAETYTGATGLSADISVLFATKADGLGGTQLGVISLPPYNRALLFDPVTGTSFEDTDGTKVYGRISFSTPTWTLAFYTNKAGVETAYSFAVATDVQFFFLEVFSLATRPTVPSGPEFGSFDVTADVVDASATERGVVNTTTQTFAGAKTFNNTITAGEDILPDADLSGNLGVNTLRFGGVWADFVSASSSFGLRDAVTNNPIFTLVNLVNQYGVYSGPFLSAPLDYTPGSRDSFGFRGRNLNGSNTHSLIMFTGNANTTGNSGLAMLRTGNAVGNSGNVELLVGTAGGTQGDFRFHKLGTTTTVGHVWTASSTDGKGYWAVAPGAATNVVSRYKYNFSYNDLTAASTTFNTPLKALDPEEMVERVLINVTTPFVGATTLTLSVGNDSGSEPEKYSTAFELVGATDYFMSQTFGLESFTSLLSTKLYFICDVNVNTLTAGALEVYIWTSKG